MKQNLLFFALGILVGVVSGVAAFYGPGTGAAGHQIRQGKIGLINPLLACEVRSGQSSHEFDALKQKVKTIVDKRKSAGSVTSAAIYFRVSDDGRWFGLNENTEFSPASLLKVPMMIAFLKLAEANPAILEQQVIYEEEAYTVKELIDRMIIASDNRALGILSVYAEKLGAGRAIAEVYADLGVHVAPGGKAAISPRTYSLVFRTLYNASYLNRKSSEAALELLSKTEFAEALMAGVPKGVTIADKFGEDMIKSSGSEMMQLHDCGIVYTATPYFLCVMTEGKHFEDLKPLIADISRVVYEEMKSL